MKQALTNYPEKKILKVIFFHFAIQISKLKHKTSKIQPMAKPQITIYQRERIFTEIVIFIGIELF